MIKVWEKIVNRLVINHCMFQQILKRDSSLALADDFSFLKCFCSEAEKSYRQCLNINNKRTLWVGTQPADSFTDFKYRGTFAHFLISFHCEPATRKLLSSINKTLVLDVSSGMATYFQSSRFFAFCWPAPAAEKKKIDLLINPWLSTLAQEWPLNLNPPPVTMELVPRCARKRPMIASLSARLTPATLWHLASCAVLLFHGLVRDLPGDLGTPLGKNAAITAWQFGSRSSKTWLQAINGPCFWLAPWPLERPVKESNNAR